MNVNFSSTPFTSIYRFKYEGNEGIHSYSNQYKVDNFAFSNNFDYRVDYNPDYDCSCGECGQTFAVGTLTAPDCKDTSVETFCAMKGIPFEKTSYASLLGEDAILKRCVLAEGSKDKKIVMLDVDKFDRFYKLSQFGNIDFCEQMYEEKYAKEVHDMILSGDEIVLPELYINSPYGFGSASFLFNGTVEKPNQCLYFAMKNIGMNKVPVAINEESYLNGKDLGLFE